MHVSFRDGFYAGLISAIALGLFLSWLWRPERQVRLHNEHLLAAIEQKKWSSVADFIDEAYQDRWGNDRALLLSRLREVMRYMRNLRIAAAAVEVRAAPNGAQWSARITVDADASELTALVKDRVNGLESPFAFEWRHASGKPWDWKLSRVSHDKLELSDAAY